MYSSVPTKEFDARIGSAIKMGSGWPFWCVLRKIGYSSFVSLVFFFFFFLSVISGIKSYKQNMNFTSENILGKKLTI